ncbi:MAG: 2Fe-2S iron-sulfur cluster-binding protein [Chloroherpetonaceae bacterium]|nr:(2Fe-2S)-binding protein [Chloroherpetonaceae bacterium]MCS7211969.1 (2Fe-2S)-binding protein [Chloroherpetonaceae bacterium]MDW8020892.1 2Fe-2S iron-sulfur cluster-binding protein [Chloroherpetonaceae bacterium]MDW8466171.1 2Fe-2S iron-sulfur cluster-binding protein [Chloroherpetonaceae bacterium]
MPKVEINGSTFDAFVDESLLGAARRHKAHIGYSCGGHGLCQTCEVIIESGMDALSPINDVEKAWLTAEKQQKGHRLACQAQIKKDAPIKLTTRAEKARRLFNNAFLAKKETLPPTSHPQGHVGEFFTFLGMETLAHISAAPMAFANAVGRVFEGKLTLNAITDAVNAWSERAPEIGEILSKTLSGLPDAIAPVTNAVADVAKGVIDTATKVVKSATGGASATATDGKEAVQAVPIKVEKK